MGNNNRKNKTRIAWLDAVRGLTVISMVFYHYMWDLVYAFGANYQWFVGKLGYVWQQSICWSFILISGFSFGIGTKSVRRGLLVSFCGVAVTVVTLRFMPEYVIWFGILTMLGACMIAFGILKDVLKKIPYFVGLPFSGLLFVIFRNVNFGYLGFEKLNFVKLPDFLYSDMISTFFGFPKEGFYSTDYFSILPWAFLFLFGFFLERAYSSLLYESKGSQKPVPVLWYLGRDALVIYILHQPIIYGMLYYLVEYGVIKL